MDIPGTEKPSPSSTTRRDTFLSRVMTALASGTIFVFYGEIMFWQQYGEGGPLPEIALQLVLTVIAYSVIAFTFLAIVDYFRVRSIWALFLTAAVAGWLAEGVLVSTMYDTFPLQLAWTGLAWHALLNVMVGWWLVRQSLPGKPLRTLLIAAGVGAFWAIWTIFWPTEAGFAVLPLGTFAVQTFAATLGLITAYAVLGRVQPTTFRMHRWAAIVLGVVYMLWFIGTVVLIKPHALLILPPLLVLVYIALRRNRSVEPPGSILEDFAVPARWPNLLMLLALPITATALFALASVLNLWVMTNVPIAVVSSCGGLGMFVASVVKVLRQGRGGAVDVVESSL